MKTGIIYLGILLFLFSSCQKDCPKPTIDLPEVTTLAVTDVGQHSAKFYGALLSTGNTTVSDFGFCWDTTHAPTINGNKVSNGPASIVQGFSNEAAGLLGNQLYYVRAFATNSKGTVYGEELNFISLKPSDTSLYFDGVYINNSGSFDNDHVDIGNNGPMSAISSTVSYTIEAWVKRAIINNPDGQERIYSKDNAFQFRILNDNFEGEIGSSAIQTPYPQDTLWHHLAFVRDRSSGTLKLFIDGQLKSTVTDNSTSFSDNGSMVCIGARNNGTGIYELWKGNIKYLRISSVARYADSFTPLRSYSSDVNTLALWPFNEGTGTILHDVSGNNHNGNIVNASWETD